MPNKPSALNTKQWDGSSWIWIIALVAKLLPDSDPLQKVTIIPRGQSQGATEQMPI